MRTVLGFALTFSLIVALAPSSAHAQDPGTAPPPEPASASAPSSAPPMVSVSSTPGDSSNAISLWGILPWGGFGVGGRFMMPFAPIPRLLTHTKFKDYWALEFGADYLHFSYGYSGGSDYAWNALLPVAGIMWQVWLLPNLGVYPKAEIGYEFGWLSGYNGPSSNTPSYGGIFINGAAGLLYQVSGGLTLRAEAGYAGAKLGVAWQF